LCCCYCCCCCCCCCRPGGSRPPERLLLKLHFAPATRDRIRFLAGDSFLVDLQLVEAVSPRPRVLEVVDPPRATNTNFASKPSTSTRNTSISLKPSTSIMKSLVNHVVLPPGMLGQIVIAILASDSAHHYSVVRREPLQGSGGKVRRRSLDLVDVVIMNNIHAK
jgi:hypothetical protein